MASGTRRPVARAAAFWDSSALLPLCARQSTTPGAIALYAAYDVVAWWATPVELASGLARLARMRQLDAAQLVRSRRLAQQLADSWSVIHPSDDLLALAVQCIQRYELRAADALQLAAAMQWCGNAPQARVFFTADRKLREAALLAGFDAQAI